MLHPHSQPTRLAPSKRGLTIIEVVFAIGIVMVGLLGIAALIPIAAEDANSSIRTDAAIRYGSSMLAELRARDVGTFNNLYRLDIDPRDDDFTATSSPGDAAIFRPVTGTFPSDSPSLPRLAQYRRGRLASFCIDPLFLSQHQSAGEMVVLGNERNAYQRDRFPYYNEYYNGVLPPKDELTIGNGWPFPRLWRVSYAKPYTNSPTRFISPNVATWLTSSANELSFTKVDDRLDPVGQIIDPLSATAEGVRQTENRYSWLATATPPLDGSNTYKLSVVVVDRRNTVNAPLLADTAPDANASLRDAYGEERVTWVSSAVSLGSTVEVEINGSEKFSDKVVAGQWVMMSQQPHVNNNGNLIPHPSIPASHRWFRVVQVGPVQYVTIGNANCWRRRLVLDGPSWSFANNSSGTPELGDTYLTIVTGAVAVIESDIRIP